MQKQFLPIGLDFAKKDLRAAFLLSFLINTSEYHSQNDQNADGWFYCTAENLKERIGFNRADVEHAVSVLRTMGLLQTQKRGMPAKIYYRVNTDADIYASACLSENDKQVCSKTTNKYVEKRQTSMLENDKQVCSKTTNKYAENQQPCLSENDSNKEHIYKEQSNNNKKQEQRIEESADFTNPLPPAPKKPVSKKAPKAPRVFDAEAIISGTNQLIQKYYPNQSKGWGDSLNNYLVNFKSKQSTCKDENFVKVCLEDVEGLLRYCSASKISDVAIAKFIQDAMKGGKNRKGWESLTFSGYTDVIDRTQRDVLNALRNGVVVTPQQDPRNTNELIALFIGKILNVYVDKKVGAVRGGEDEGARMQQHLTYYEQIKTKLSTDPAKFQEQLVWVAACLKAECKDLADKTTNTYKPKGLPFNEWILKSHWENFAPTKIKQPQIKPTASETPQIEQIAQPAQKAAISENKQPLQAVSQTQEDTEAIFPEFNVFLDLRFIPALFKVSQVQNGKVLNLVDILRANGVSSADDFILYLYEVCEGFPTEASNPTCWDKMRQIWNTQLAQLVVKTRQVS